MPTPTSSVAALMMRNVVGVFGERDAAARAAAIAEVYASDAVLRLGGEEVRGHEALDRHVQALLDGAPGFVFQPLGDAEVDGRLGTRAWGFGPPGAPPVVTGRDVVVVEGDRISEILVLVHPPTAERLTGQR